MKDLQVSAVHDFTDKFAVHGPLQEASLSARCASFAHEEAG